MERRASAAVFTGVVWKYQAYYLPKEPFNERYKEWGGPGLRLVE